MVFAKASYAKGLIKGMVKKLMAVARPLLVRSAMGSPSEAY